jgi:hypothetical protein
MLEYYWTPIRPILSFTLTATLYRNATSSPERVASPATYLLISRALIAPEACLGVDEAEADAFAGLEDVADVTDAAVVAGLTDEEADVVIVALAGLTDEEADVVIVALAGLIVDEVRIVLLVAGLEI